MVMLPVLFLVSSPMIVLIALCAYVIHALRVTLGLGSQVDFATRIVLATGKWAYKGAQVVGSGVQRISGALSTYRNKGKQTQGTIPIMAPAAEPPVPSAAGTSRGWVGSLWGMLRRGSTQKLQQEPSIPATTSNSTTGNSTPSGSLRGAPRFAYTTDEEMGLGGMMSAEHAHAQHILPHEMGPHSSVSVVDDSASETQARPSYRHPSQYGPSHAPGIANAGLGGTGYRSDSAYDSDMALAALNAAAGADSDSNISRASSSSRMKRSTKVVFRYLTPHDARLMELCGELFSSTTHQHSSGTQSETIKAEDVAIVSLRESQTPTQMMGKEKGKDAENIVIASENVVDDDDEDSMKDYQSAKGDAGESEVEQEVDDEVDNMDVRTTLMTETSSANGAGNTIGSAMNTLQDNSASTASTKDAHIDDQLSKTVPPPSIAPPRVRVGRSKDGSNFEYHVLLILRKDSDPWDPIFEDLVAFVEFSQTLHDPRHLRIEKLLVSPFYENQGFGRKMLRELHRRPRVETVEVWSLWHAEGFYRGLGYGDVVTRQGERVVASFGPLLIWVKADHQALGGGSLGRAGGMGWLERERGAGWERGRDQEFVGKFVNLAMAPPFVDILPLEGNTSLLTGRWGLGEPVRLEGRVRITPSAKGYTEDEAAYAHVNLLSVKVGLTGKVFTSNGDARKHSPYEAHTFISMGPDEFYAEGDDSDDECSHDRSGKGKAAKRQKGKNGLEADNNKKAAPKTDSVSTVSDPKTSLEGENNIIESNSHPNKPRDILFSFSLSSGSNDRLHPSIMAGNPEWGFGARIEYNVSATVKMVPVSNPKLLAEEFNKSSKAATDAPPILTPEAYRKQQKAFTLQYMHNKWSLKGITSWLNYQWSEFWITTAKVDRPFTLLRYTPANLLRATRVPPDMRRWSSEMDPEPLDHADAVLASKISYEAVAYPMTFGPGDNVVVKFKVRANQGSKLKLSKVKISVEEIQGVGIDLDSQKSKARPPGIPTSSKGNAEAEEEKEDEVLGELAQIVAGTTLGRKWMAVEVMRWEGVEENPLDFWETKEVMLRTPCTSTDLPPSTFFGPMYIGINPSGRFANRVQVDHKLKIRFEFVNTETNVTSYFCLDPSPVHVNGFGIDEAREIVASVPRLQKELEEEEKRAALARAKLEQRRAGQATSEVAGEKRDIGDFRLPSDVSMDGTIAEIEDE
ncbi:hypothetical protein HDV05_000078 [Chytridiales sp. JEL 0842]|nr:hypothetical protein HDV05_000078 [Chytridiales sp. JEL 0842]